MVIMVTALACLGLLRQKYAIYAIEVSPVYWHAGGEGFLYVAIDMSLHVLGLFNSQGWALIWVRIMIRIFL